MRFDPASYPGRPPETPTLVFAGRSWPLVVDGTTDAPFDRPAGAEAADVLTPGAVRWSLAYGSNADPDRLVDKGLDGRGAIVLPASVLGRRRAWEARRATTGAVPLTLVSAPGVRLDVWLLGIHVDDTATLDSSEGRGGNYLLGRVGPAAVADRFLVPDALAYGPTTGTSVVSVEARPATYPELDQRAAGVLADDATTARLRIEPLHPPHRGPWPSTPLEDLPLFVYGTLRPGERYWPRISDLVVVVGDATCAGRVVPTRFGWPAADLAAPGRFDGVLLRPRDPGAARSLVEVVDRIEDAPRLFRRRAVPVGTEGGRRWAMVYEWASSDPPPAQSDE